MSYKFTVIWTLHSAILGITSRVFRSVNLVPQISPALWSQTAATSGQKREREIERERERETGGGGDEKPSVKHLKAMTDILW